MTNENRDAIEVEDRALPQVADQAEDAPDDNLNHGTDRESESTADCDDAEQNPSDSADEIELDENGEEIQSKSALPVYPVAERVDVRTQEDLEEVLSAHRDWMDAVLHPKKHVPVGRANLSHADLRSFDLKNANLSSADLRGANLSGLDLTGVNFSAANLEGACLQSVDLTGAKLRRAKLKDTDLRAANMDEANITDTDLSEAILTSEDHAKRLKDAESAPEPDQDDSDPKIGDDLGEHSGATEKVETNAVDPDQDTASDKGDESAKDLETAPDVNPDKNADGSETSFDLPTESDDNLVAWVVEHEVVEDDESQEPPTLH